MKKIGLGAMLLAMLAIPSVTLAYNYPGFKWGASTIGWDTSGLNVPAWRTAATVAMNDWNATGARLVMVNYAGSKNTMSYYWDSSTNLAYTIRYRQYVFWGNMYRATISLNDYHRWNPPYTSGIWYDLPSVLRHELGHAVPLDHVDNSLALMYPVTSPWFRTPVTADERNGIRAIYGTR